MVCVLSGLQSPLQAKLRPAIWLPGIRCLHSCLERWEIPDVSPAICVQKVVDGVARLAENEKIFLHQVDREKNMVQIFSYTKAEWLDVVEIEFYPGQFSGTEAKARSFSSGLLPVWVPLSFLFNTILFFVPFYDYRVNRRRLERIKEAMHLSRLNPL